MNRMDIEKLINESDMVLVGIGESLESGFSVLESSEIYKRFLRKLEQENLQENDYEWVYPYLLEEAETDSPEAEKRNSFYKKLKKLLQDKNYFLITMNMDSMPEQTGFAKERVVKPFGNYELLQCDKACTKELWDGREEKERILRCLKSDTEKLAGLKKGVCPHCGGEAVFNNVNAGVYIEEGYIENWKHYTKWIEGTMNRKVCILELGVMLYYPSIIRWPFEKMGYLNQKASFVRINDVLWQLTEELKEKGISIKENPISFFLER